MNTPPKNKIIILGNGFDLSHNLPTTFEDFVTFLVKELFDDSVEVKSSIFDKNKSIAIYHIINELKLKESIVWETLVQSKFSQLNEIIKEFWSLNPDLTLHPGLGELNKMKGQFYPNLLFQDKHLLWESIYNTGQFSWINFEKSYYKQLKRLCRNSRGGFDNYSVEEVKSLNDQFDEIKSEFIRYLKTLKVTPSMLNTNHSEYFHSGKIYNRTGETLDYRNNRAESQLILNFNYTSLPERVYQLDFNNIRPRTSIINIHGVLDSIKTSNPVIFGYGDEMDEDYHSLESLEEDEVLRHFKSTQYSKTHNYHSLLGFIETGPFQVDVLGHGCGMTDRVLLNTVFEHDNCNRIKIFQYKSIDHYIETYTHISRHFSRDKKDLLRRRILPFDPAAICPQWND